jgi:hypothetical protein
MRFVFGGRFIATEVVLFGKLGKIRFVKNEIESL